MRVILFLTTIYAYLLTFTLGSGVQWYESYAAADAHSRLLVGGLSAGGSVGSAASWAIGGGHSALAPNYGLGEWSEIRLFVKN